MVRVVLGGPRLVFRVGRLVVPGFCQQRDDGVSGDGAYVVAGLLGDEIYL